MVDGENTDNFAEFEAQATGEKPEATGDIPETLVEQEEPEGDEPEGEIEAQDEPGDEGDEPEPEDKPRRNKKPAHERIAELNTKLREAERREAEALRRLDETTRKPAEPQPEAVADDDGKPNPDDFPLGDVDSGYAAALAEWIADRRVHAILAERDTKAAVQKQNDAYKAQAAGAVDRYPDYEDVVTKGAELGEWPCTQIMTLSILDSPVGADLAYALASDKAEAARIAALHPMEQAREMGRIEARFIGRKDEPPSRKTTSAPPPPVTQPRGSGGKFTASPDTEDFSSFEKLANGR